ncbi:MAG: hypothetical protein AB7E52_09310 [Bdellovibrionales bacterium]
MQTNVYLENPYLHVFESSVLESRIIKKKTAIAAKENLFYPGGGGQPIDLGSIEINNELVPVVDIKKMDKKVYAVLDKKIDLMDGAKITQKIDGERRLGFMKLHSAAHILMAAVKRNTENYAPEKIEISDDGSKCAIFFEGMWDGSEEALTKMVNEANAAIDKNLSLTPGCFEDAQNAAAEYGELFRAAGPMNGPVRIICVEGWDANPCGGTHVRTSAEIGRIVPLAYDRSSITFRADRD